MDAGDTHSRMLQQDGSGDDVIRTAIRLGLLAFLIYWSFVLLRPFIPVLAWAAVLAVALNPAFDWLSAHLGHRPRVAAIVMTIAMLTVFLGPATWLGIGLVDGLRNISDELTTGDIAIPSPPEGVRNWPLVGVPLHDLWKKASENLAVAIRELAPHLKPMAGTILAIAGSAGTGTLKFLASVVIAGFLLPSGPRIVASVRTMLTRIVPRQGADFLALAGATIRTVAQGVIGVAVLQSLLAGIGLKIAGVPHAGVLAFAVLVLGIVQIGSAPIFLPVIIWVWTAKDMGSAILITIYLVLVGFSDNALKPLLMGRGLSTPVLVIFVGVLGGTLAHGIVGLFVGPIILAVAWDLLMAWGHDDSADVVMPRQANAEVKP
ncbi:Predicted PurR-regulated permease PerM [Bradyrhizobium erythrophlei]|uniref:Predicted PurR-regulated permease PerM n=2 Tax=Bradyrhizobium erythrophlei TaxID=1437360 RepID=A0A1M7TL84_9BRAD|nr:AI-2E family transporter [Bradyrhizobium erythrophlei]SHN71408.1 Predicted PurR-regulated permease PerM [Bradyrhizobium erythrophlei]